MNIYYHPLTKLIVILSFTMSMFSCATPPRVVHVENSNYKPQSTGSKQGLLAATQTEEKNTDEPAVQTLPSFYKPQEIKSFLSEKIDLPFLENITPISITVDEMPVLEFIHYLFGDVFAVDYILNDVGIDAKKSVSLQLKRKFTNKEIFDIARDVLKEKDIIIKQGEPQILLIEKLDAKAKSSNVALGIGRNSADVPKGAETVYQVVELHYSKLQQLARVIQEFSDVKYLPFKKHNGMVVYGKRASVLKALAVIDMADSPSLKGKYIGLLRLDYLSADEFEKLLLKVLIKEGISIASSGDSALSLTSVEHLNGVIVHAQHEDLLERVYFWKEQLDKPGKSSEQRFFVYEPQYSKAVDLAETIKELLDIQQKGEKITSTTSTKSTNTNKQGNVTVDEKSNTLIFYTKASKFQEIKILLQRLDVLPLQVMLEATLVEVTLTDSFSQGVEWFVRNNKINYGTKNGLGDLGAGFTFSLTSIDFDLFLNFLQSENRVNILSNPKMLVTDGETASIEVGTQIPIISSTAEGNTNDSLVVQSIQYRNTGVSLSITPTVNSKNYILMDIVQSLSEAGENTISGIDSPIVLQRDFKTKVMAKDGEVLIIGGLISENNSDKDTKTPWLADIPLLGYFFKNKSESKVRTELIVMITPKIVAADDDLQRIKEHLRPAFKSIDF
jgi:general secretion pathway protein D